MRALERFRLELLRRGTEVGAAIADAARRATLDAMERAERLQARVEALTAEAVGLLQGTRGDTAFLVELVRRMSARRT